MSPLFEAESGPHDYYPQTEIGGGETPDDPLRMHLEPLQRRVLYAAAKIPPYDRNKLPVIAKETGIAQFKIDNFLARAAESLGFQTIQEAVDAYQPAVELLNKLHPDDAKRLLSFSPKQFEVLCYLAYGHTPDEIASHLGVSKNNVYYHIRRIHRRLGTTTDESAGIWFSKAAQELGAYTKDPWKKESK